MISIYKLKWYCSQILKSVTNIDHTSPFFYIKWQLTFHKITNTDFIFLHWFSLHRLCLSININFSNGSNTSISLCVHILVERKYTNVLRTWYIWSVCIITSMKTISLQYVWHTIVSLVFCTWHLHHYVSSTEKIFPWSFL